ncbi:nitrate reductase subunit alpha [Pseudonocardia asaccharolytica]|uniref:Nitrate reductase alpha subunit n=1 Tax=Pseudonocardia asaccharolytica DSM 44247 = NBRC 16224 TaxID=1123024 RepID=A0A511D6I2_9PSEU|nr:nitrate reductase subunit alpha [Pseudonocardia asaccharolytica]GEL20395.1 nitrate reductase subunit alpha [Pseudonocardia asaccharolytica DSM 44247 = NBRC 16224]
MTLSADSRGRSAAGTDGSAADALLRTGRFFTRREVSEDLRAVFRRGGREGDVFYRDRWSHDKVVRSTHGVNCTGSCSWKVYVKDGIITWETQQTDYPSVGPDSPEYEPRGCPRGAAFSWYTYSPTRVRYPYARGVLVESYREAKARLGDPVAAWAEITTDPEKRRRYQSARGKGGHVRVSWDEAVEIVAAAHVHTIKTYGPDRIAGFSPIPAMSMVSHAAGSRFIELVGGAMTSFYDWYADLPVASPQVFGDQTDVPESGDWWNATYLLMWGSNVPVTRTPDAHWMAEARYKGQKVVVVSPDYADNTKFADTWLPAQPGTDGALAMAMGHVILKEFFLDRRVPFFVDFAQRYTDLPFLVTLEENTARDGAYLPGKFLTAAGLGEDGEGAAWKTVLVDGRTGEPVVPNGSMGFRYTESGMGRWNLDLGDVAPQLTVLDPANPESAEVLLPRFDGGVDGGDAAGGVLRRGVPVRRIGGQLVTTVFDLMLAQYGVHRAPLPGVWPSGYDDPSQPYTPAWQEPITSVPAEQVVKVAREMARNAEESGGKTMIIMGAGICQWFHGDATYRAVLALLMLTGSMGRNGGGWAHYVGQEKCRPITGWATMAMATDWQRPPRQMIGTAYWYTHTDQWRYDGYRADALTSPLAQGHLKGMHTIDTIALSARLGWMPSYPQFDRNPLDLADEIGEKDVAGHVAEQLRTGKLNFAIEDPDAPENWPRCLTLWRANLLGSSAKGDEYFLRHLLGTHNNLLADQTPEDRRPRDVVWRDGEPPEGKLDLLLSLDFRMTSSTLLSDIVLPAATWYEKHDLNTTDMHPFVHAFSPAIDPPFESRTDFDAFNAIATRFSELARTHLGVRRDIVAVPLQHDTPGETAQPGGRVLDWRAGSADARSADAPRGVEPIPGKTMPNFVVVERDYPALADKMVTVGPLVDRLGMTTKAITYHAEEEIAYLGAKNGVMLGGAGDGRPAIDTDAKMAEAILTLSATTNGRLAVHGFAEAERRTGMKLVDLAVGSEDKRISFADTQARPVPVITSPEWSGSETGGRRYAPFTVNVERGKPWHTLTGRMHFLLDHDWMSDFGELLPIYRAPLDMHKLFGEAQPGTLGDEGASVTVRYLTPHSKWSIHSEYQDNLFMLSLSRGGPVVWMSEQDAGAIGVRDNDWVEAVNRNGVLVARAVVSHRMPAGTVFVYHAQERVVNVPKSEATGLRGGIHNSLTRILVKPTHLIGGYAQLSFAFNYLGPTGNQRDEITVIRRRSQEVQY